MEREKSDEYELIVWKELRLINPEEANELGVPTESPIFGSPRVDSETLCGTCGVHYKPLVYRVGLIKPHHFHPSRLGLTDPKCGGIYLNLFSADKILFPPMLQYGWVAILEPFGRSVYPYSSSLKMMAVEEARVHAIRAYCVRPEHSFCRERLKEGFIVEPMKGLLLPWCDGELSTDISLRFRFQISDLGEVHFSKI